MIFVVKRALVALVSVAAERGYLSIGAVYHRTRALASYDNEARYAGKTTYPRDCFIAAHYPFECTFCLSSVPVMCARMKA